MRAGPASVALGLVLTLSLTGCGSSGEKDGEKDKDKAKGVGSSAAADTTTCVAKAKPFSGTVPANYPKTFPLPTGAVLFAIEDRGADGAIGTAIVKADLKAVLAQLNGPAQDAGWKVTEGETETHDAEANWEGNGYRGRWAIRDSSSCPGEVVVQVLAKRQ